MITLIYLKINFMQTESCTKADKMDQEFNTSESEGIIIFYPQHLL